MRCVPHTSCGGAGPLTSPHRADHPYAVAHDLALRHQDLEQTAKVGFILAVRRYAPERGGFRPFARLYANVKGRDFQRDRVFLIMVSPSWLELHARGRKLQAAGVAHEGVAQRLGVDERRWEENERTCTLGAVPLGVGEVG